MATVKSSLTGCGIFSKKATELWNYALSFSDRFGRLGY